jgi:regulator of sigma E protease
MTVLVFLAVLVALIVVHELGHFAAAKLSGMRVDEFGVGYPPRAAARG